MIFSNIVAKMIHLSLATLAKNAKKRNKIGECQNISGWDIYPLTFLLFPIEASSTGFNIINFRSMYCNIFY